MRNLLALSLFLLTSCDLKNVTLGPSDDAVGGSLMLSHEGHRVSGTYDMDADFVSLEAIALPTSVCTPYCVEFPVQARILDSEGVTVAYSTPADVPGGWRFDYDGFSGSRVLPAYRSLERSLKREFESTGSPYVKALYRLSHTVVISLERARELNGGQDASVHESRFDHAERTWEFKQEIHLYVQEDLSTRLAHTATVGLVFKRPLYDGGPWLLHQVSERCNHGTCPGMPGMREYAVCGSDTPVTRLMYTANRSCRDGYNFTHSGNDDTSLQINHAYGRYEPTNTCTPSQFSWQPTCGFQW